jgi:hypothetical protein
MPKRYICADTLPRLGKDYVREIEEMRYYELTDVIEVLQPIAIGCLTSGLSSTR